MIRRIFLYIPSRIPGEIVPVIPSKIIISFSRRISGILSEMFVKIIPEIPSKFYTKKSLGVQLRIPSIIRPQITADMDSIRYFPGIPTEILTGIRLESSPGIS